MQEEYYVQKINKAIDYIEVNYDKKLTTKELAKVSAFSEYHFHRLFKLITGETVNNYIKRLKMGKAKRNLVINSEAITDIALNYGYNSSANFARDFKSFHNITASSVRKQKKDLVSKKTHNKIESKLEFLGIELLEKRFVIYKRISTGYNTVTVKKAFSDLLDFIHKNKIEYKDVTSIGIGYDDPDFIDPEKCRYDACISIDEKYKLDVEYFNKREFDPGKCAIYIFEGRAEDFAVAWDYIFKEWINSCKYTLGESPHFEEYLMSERYAEGYFKAKLCLPVIFRS